MKPKENNENEAIGARIKARRKLLQFSTQNFSSLLGVSPQQLYKYENGQNRVSAQQLAKIAKILNVTADYFFENTAVIPFIKPAINDSFRAAELANQPETANLVRYYISIADYRTRTAIVELVTSINKYLTKQVPR